MKLRYFKIEDFDSPDAPGSGKLMDERLLQLVDDLRHTLGYPLIVNSGFRTREHNAKVKGSPNSAHTRGKAVDIRAMSGRQRFEIVREAMKLGVNRIGIARTFVHLDIDEDLPQLQIWIY